MPKFKSGDTLIFRQLDIIEIGTRYIAIPLKIKRARSRGTLEMETSNSLIQSYPVLRDCPHIATANIGQLNSTTYPDGICVWCYTIPTHDASRLKRQMAAKLHEMLVKQADRLRLKINRVVSWGTAVPIPSPEIAGMSNIIEEEYK